jgi:hypothetical protein
VALALLAVAVVTFTLHAATQWARDGALREAAIQARSTGQINAALLRNNLDKFRALPFVLTQDVDLRAALQGASTRQIEALDEKLESLSRGVGASAIYVLDKKVWLSPPATGASPPLSSESATNSALIFKGRSRTAPPNISRLARSVTKPACICRVGSTTRRA